jgi:hypothetical protein
MPYFVEFLRVYPTDAEAAYERLPEPQVSFGAAQQHALAQAYPLTDQGARTFRIVDEAGQPVLSEG